MLKSSTSSVSYLIYCLLSMACIELAFAAKPQVLSRVIDGDTLVLKGGEVVRLLGINSPEVARYGKPGEPGGLPAKKYLQNLTKNQSIYLEYDEELTDKYGRTLAQVFLEGGLHVNAELLRQGMAMLSIHPPNLKYAHLLLAEQRYAEKQQLGVWSLPSHKLRLVTLKVLSQAKGWGRFSGRVKEIKYTKKGAKLYLAKRCYIWISRSYYAYFPQLDEMLGQDIEVRAWVRKRGDEWSMRILHPSQLILSRN